MGVRLFSWLTCLEPTDTVFAKIINWKFILSGNNFLKTSRPVYKGMGADF